MEDPKNPWKTFTEEIEVTGQQLVHEITKLLAEGNVRKLQLRSEKGDIFLSIPLTAGAVAGGVAVIAAPWLAIIAGLMAKVKLEVVRAEPPAPVEPPSEKSPDL